MNENFVKNRKLFWKQVRKCGANHQSGECSGVKDKDGNMLINEMDVCNRWKEYFSNLMKGDNERHGCVSAKGFGGIKRGPIQIL